MLLPWDLPFYFCSQDIKPLPMNSKLSTKPLISVILPIRNADAYLAASIDSLLFQNYQNIEIIAIDDASIDGSLGILNAFKKEDKRLKVFKNVKKYDLAITLNRCLRKAKGKFIVFMDPKDTITKNKFQKQLDFLLDNPKVVGVGTQCVYLNDEGKRVGKSNFPALHEDISQKPIHGVSVLFEGIMVNKFKLPKDLLYFSPNKHLFLYSDMTLKLLQYGELANLPEYLHFHHTHTYYGSVAKNIKHLWSLGTLWMKSKFDYETNPSIKTFFSTPFKPSAS